MNGIKADAQKRVEQDANLVSRKIKLKRLTRTYDESLLTTDKRYKHYKANEDGLFVRDGLQLLKQYRENGSVKNFEIFKPK